jgi:ribose 5-phosphate isomerase B
MRVAVAFDRRGTRLRAAVIAELMTQGHEVLDLGVGGSLPDGDYASKAREAARVILAGTVERGVVASHSGVGSSFVANKIDGIRAAACSDTYTAQRSGEQGMNLLCLGGDLTKVEAAEIVRAFVSTRPANALVARFVLLGAEAPVVSQASRPSRSASHAA